MVADLLQENPALEHTDVEQSLALEDIAEESGETEWVALVDIGSIDQETQLTMCAGELYEVENKCTQYLKAALEVAI